MTALLLAALAAAAPPEPPRVVSAEPLPAWSAKFRRADGWLGADGVYSVPVSPTRTVWLFGDTFVGALKNNSRAGTAMVNNTVGVQDGDTVAFPVRRGPDGKPRSQFPPPDDGNGHFWLQAGAYHAGKLYAFLPQIELTKGGGAFGFRQVGTWVGVVANPDDDPAAWKVTRTRLPFCEFSDRRTLTFGSAVLTEGGFTYVYGFAEAAGAGIGGKKLVVARVPAGRLADPPAWRFYRGGEWREAPDPEPLAGGLAAEASVSYLAGLKAYALVYTENGIGDRVVGRFARSPAGPWSAPVLLYRCPDGAGEKAVFTYAAKAHPQLGGGRELVISYCANAFDFARVVNDPTLYWPRFVRVVLE